MRSDLQIFARVEKELPVGDQEQVFRDWSRYVSNGKALRSAVRSYVGFLEYNFWLTMNGERWFMDGLDQLLGSFRRAKAKNEGECFQAFVELVPAIDSGLKNMQRVFHLEGNKSVKRLDLYGKICFREIGDMIEGTLKPFMQLVLLMSRIGSSKPNKPATINNMSLGAISAELLKSKAFNELYQPLPWNVPINQWRNVAQHYSFTVDRSHAALECEYGTKNKKKISVDRDSLMALLRRVHAILYVHKIAHLLFFIENTEELRSRFSVDSSDLTEDAIKSHVMTVVVANQFKLLSLKSKRDWQMTLSDQSRRAAEDRYAALNKIAAAFRLVVKDRALNITLYYKNERGEQTLKATVK